MPKRSIRLIALAATALLISCGRNADRPFVVASVSDVSSLDPHLLDVNHPTGSVIWSLSVKPKGAGFQVVGSPKPFIRNMLPTDCEFGPDGAFYWSDWVGGWDMPNKGRIFRVTGPEPGYGPAPGSNSRESELMQ